MKVTFLGSGDSAGIPMHGCGCSICYKSRIAKEYRREGASLLLEVASTRLLLDAGISDLTGKFQNETVSGVLLSRFVSDRLSGLFRVRFGIGDQIPVYSTADTAVKHDIFRDNELLEFVKITPFEALYIDTIRITPVPLNATKSIMGYCVEHGYSRLAYLVGASAMPDASYDFVKDWRPSILVVDATLPPQIEPTDRYNDLIHAVGLAESLGSEIAILTQVGHELDAWFEANQDYRLPESVELAHDGMTIIL